MRRRLDPDQAPVLSASRSRDMVHRCPELLAAMLAGEADVRLGRWRPQQRLALEDIGALVLWTKQPAPLLECAPLRKILEGFAGRGGIVTLQLTVTGFGGSAVEPGIPRPWEAAGTLGRAIDAGLVGPRAVKLRYDPVAEIRFEGGAVYSNMRMEVFGRVMDLFQPMGVERVTASMLDSVSYPAVNERLARAGGRVERAADVDFMRRIAAACGERGLRFSTCVLPYDEELVEREGCIDGRVINSWGGRPVWDTLHNQVGAQRRNCWCTYSLDMGYSPGVEFCSSGGFGCLYCYSQGAGIGKLGPKVRALLESVGEEEWTRVEE